MKIAKNEELCCGCSACMNICPVDAVTMQKDIRGFNVPYVKEDVCINCELCQKACPINTPPGGGGGDQKIYAAKLKDEKRLQSQSGGGFTAFAETILEYGGIVYGVGIVEEKYVQYQRINSLKNLYIIKGSKYVQASINHTFKMVKDDLQNAETVLFSGTPCQVNGLLLYLNNYKKVVKSNLYTCDVICHGVPSPKLLFDYLQHLETKNKGPVESFNFRDKDVGWREHIESYITVNGKKKFAKVYADLFRSCLPFRESCYKCQWTSYDRSADLTVGDFWGIEKSHPDFDDNKGVSLVMVNSCQGDLLFQKARNKLNIKESNSQECVQYNLLQPTERPDNVDKFWDEYLINGFEYIVRKYTKLNYVHRLKKVIKRFIGVFLKV